MDITEEMVKAAAEAIADVDCEEHAECFARAAATALAPLIAAQALREAALKALTAGEPKERRLCVGGPRHGSEVTWDGDTTRVVMPFEPAPFWTDESAALTENDRDRTRTYTRQKVWREVDGVRYLRRVWLFDEHRLDEAGMQRLADAVVQQWMAAGTRVDP